MYINIWYLATCNIVVTFQKIWLIISPLSYILGQLYLENKELLRLLDSQNQALGQRNNQIDNLQREKRNLQRYLEGTYIHSIQQQNEQQSSTISALETKIQLQNQRQQYFILLAAVIFAMVCFLFFFYGSNPLAAW